MGQSPNIVPPIQHASPYIFFKHVSDKHNYTVDPALNADPKITFQSNTIKVHNYRSKNHASPFTLRVKPIIVPLLMCYITHVFYLSRLNIVIMSKSIALQNIFPIPQWRLDTFFVAVATRRGSWRRG
jgi:hypothetical protein